jgi:hypothetical protein
VVDAYDDIDIVEQTEQKANPSCTTDARTHDDATHTHPEKVHELFFCCRRGMRRRTSSQSVFSMTREHDDCHREKERPYKDSLQSRVASSIIRVRSHPHIFFRSTPTTHHKPHTTSSSHKATCTGRSIHHYS